MKSIAWRLPRLLGLSGLGGDQYTPPMTLLMNTRVMHLFPTVNKILPIYNSDRRNNRTALLALILLAFGVSPLLRAGPPFITDDPEPPGNKQWEINVAWTDERRPGGGQLSEIPLLDANYGIGDQIQLKYEVAWLQVNEAGESSHTGLGNSLAGVKWRFYNDEKNAFSISTYPQYEFRNPRSSSGRRGVDVDENLTLLPFEIQKEVRGFLIYADAGRVLPSKTPNTWFGGIVVQHDVTEKLALGVELHTETNNGFTRSLLLGNVGATLTMSKKVSLLLAVGEEFHNHFERRATFESYLAVQLHL